ncbi:colicin E1 family microcin immunity protein [Serratia sp. L9]|uniref:colicin E1 family microcin immunity protein n=1 Tax=Serratia sp. L9 TaxID=3423946 RepID=UPI003D67B69E
MVLCGGLAVYIDYTGFNQGHSVGMYLIFGLSAVLFPFAKCLIETLALKYTTREFWSRGLFVETAAKNGLYALYHMACFVVSIPQWMTIETKWAQHAAPLQHGFCLWPASPPLTEDKVPSRHR